jgi:hypothetical protein
MATLLAERASKAVEGRSSRRTFIKRAALVGAALSVDPLKYIFEPTSAYATLTCNFGLGCGVTDNCSAPNAPPGCGAYQGDPGTYSDPNRNNGVGGCGDGYTAFCCQLTGGDNQSCPQGSFIAGWWKAANSSICNGGNRYIIDCNARCNHNPNGCDTCVGDADPAKDLSNEPWCKGGSGNTPCHDECTDFTCHCAQGECARRRTACNWFRYAQCNKDIDCSGPVVCRLVSCDKPYEAYPNSCGTYVHSDNDTVCHRALCLPNAC